MSKLVRLFKQKGVRRILDLGCGSGRHVVYLAKKGFDIYGVDSSKSGIKIAKSWLKKENLKAQLKIGNIYAKLPYKNKFFDAVISVQTMHHGRPKKIKKLIVEIERILKENGAIFITVPKTKNQANKLKKIEERTFVPLDGNEKGLVHFYFSKNLIKEFFGNFYIRNIHIDSVDHYCFTGLKI